MMGLSSLATVSLAETCIDIKGKEWPLVVQCCVTCRLFDHSMEGFKNWEFMTTHCWGEKAAGDWILEIYDSPSQVRSQKAPGSHNYTNYLESDHFYLNVFHLSVIYN